MTFQEGVAKARDPAIPRFDILAHWSVGVGRALREQYHRSNEVVTAIKMTKPCFRCSLLLVFSALVTAHGQPLPDISGAARTQGPAQLRETPEISDPLGRSTPHGTVFGFLQAAQAGHYKEATQYLQLSKKERSTQ